MLPMTTVTFKGYVASVELDIEAGILHGEVINTRSILTFSTADASAIMSEFEATIEDYEQWCVERGVEPEKPYSGTLSLRMGPDLHRALATRATVVGTSLNTFLVSALENCLKAAPDPHAEALVKLQGSIASLSERLNSPARYEPRAIFTSDSSPAPITKAQSTTGFKRGVLQ
jgi:predicted HicB family RNase H-like nuclease